MGKFIIGAILLTVLIYGFWFLVINKTINMISDNKTQIESKLGKKILFDKDSVVIIDYSQFDETYTLSNGRKVNIKLIK